MLIVLFTVWWVGYIFYCTYEFKVDYNANRMEIVRFDEYPTGGSLMFYTSYSGKVNRLATKYTENGEEIGLIFVHMYRTLQDIHNDNIAISDHNNINLEEIKNGSNIFINEDNFPSHYRVYYTSVSFKEIVSSSNKKLKSIIKKSHLMFEKEH